MKQSNLDIKKMETSRLIMNYKRSILLTVFSFLLTVIFFIGSIYFLISSSTKEMWLFSFVWFGGDIGFSVLGLKAISTSIVIRKEINSRNICQEEITSENESKPDTQEYKNPKPEKKIKTIRFTRKKVIVSAMVGVLSIITLVAIIIPVTEAPRKRAKILREMNEDIAGFRSGAQSSIDFTVYIGYNDDLKLKHAYIEQIREMYKNKETELLRAFLSHLENVTYLKTFEDIEETVVACMAESGDLVYALDFLTALKPWIEQNNWQISFPSDSDLLSDYIAQNGIKTFTKTPGEGFYAQYTDEYSENRVGLQNSPLYDVVSITYNGDFKKYHTHGVKLNQYYEETNYSTDTYYFRDVLISFSHFEENIVWSGDYLFCLDSDDNLKDFAKVE